MAWTTGTHDTAKAMLMRNGRSSNESLMAMFGSSPLPPLRGLEDARTRVSYGPSFYSLDRHSSYEEEAPEDSPRHAEKKRRLTTEQVRSLELSFAMENKLEPEKKQKLATDLGLQPRQVAVWFQNRRARWKTKQLEHDFDILKSQYDSVVAERERLRAEVMKLTTALQARKQENKNGVHQKVEKEHQKVEKEKKSDVTESGLVLDTESKILEKESPVYSDYTETIDGDSPSPDHRTILYIQKAAGDNSEIHQVGTLQQVDTSGSPCAPFHASFDAVNQSYAYQQHFSAKLEEASSPSEEPYSFCLFSMDDKDPAWSWMQSSLL